MSAVELSRHCTAQNGMSIKSLLHSDQIDAQKSVKLREKYLQFAACCSERIV